MEMGDSAVAEMPVFHGDLSSADFFDPRDTTGPFDFVSQLDNWIILLNKTEQFLWYARIETQITNIEECVNDCRQKIAG